MDYNSVMEEIVSRADNACGTYGKNRWICTVLYGSQNYNIDTRESDIDTRTIIFPSKEEIFRGCRANPKTIVFENGEDCMKDVRDFIMNAARGGISFLECMYSQFIVVNPRFQEYWNMITEKKDYFCTYARPRVASCALGLANNYYKKYQNMKKDKDYLHLCWVHSFMERFQLEPFWKSLRPPRYVIDSYWYRDEATELLLEDCVEFSKKISPETREQRNLLDDHAIVFGFSLIDTIMEAYLHEVF